MTKAITYIWAASLLMAGLAQAAIINVSDAKNADGGSASLGTLTNTMAVADGADGTASGGLDLIYEITDLNLDGGASTDDKAVIRFKVSAGGAIQTTTASGWLSSTGNNMDGDGDWLQVQNVDVDVYLNGILDAGASAASSMTALTVQLAGWRVADGDAGTINGTFRTATATNQKFATADNQTILMQYIIADGAAGSWRFLDMDYTVNVVPEPATLGFVAAFGGGLLFIRRLIQM